MMKFMETFVSSAGPLIILCLLMAVSNASTPSNRNEPSFHDQFEAGPLDIAFAEFSPEVSDTPPVGAYWEMVELPHIWDKTRKGTFSGWYRFKLPDDPYTYRAGAYLWRFSMNISVWLNTQFLGDGGKFDEPIARNWNRPFLFLLPSSAWKSTDNYLYIRLGGYYGWGAIAPIVVGPYAELRTDYETRFMWQITFNQATFLIFIVTALVAFTLWFSDRQSTLYGIFGVSCIAWSIYSLNNFVQEIPVSAKTWWWLVHSGIDWFGVTLALFAHRLLNMSTPARDRLLVLFACISTCFFLVVDLSTLAKYNNYFHLLTLLIAIYLVFLSFWKSYKEASPEAIALTCCMSIVAIFGIHDYGMNTMLTATLWRNQFFWLQFSAPILILTMLVILARRFALSLLMKADAEYQVHLERERIFSDIHDDVGSKVLSLVYSAENEQQAELARDVLREIRSVVAGADQRADTLQLLLESYQTEARQRCEMAGIALDWTCDESNLRDVSHLFQYHVQRIIRELISNCIKHACTNRVDILIRIEPNQINVAIRDYGKSKLDFSQFNALGNGMAGVRRRVNQLKGKISWNSANPGCVVTISLPLTG